MTTASIRRRAVQRLAIFGALSLFIAAPTPGNVGGCGGNVYTQPIQIPNDSMGRPTQTQEYAYFDQGLCAGFCQQLLNCGLLCSAMLNPPGGSPGACQADINLQRAAYEQCIRMNMAEDNAVPFQDGIFPTDGNGSIRECPHRCPAGTYTNRALQGDVIACSDAIMGLRCGTTGAGSVAYTFRSGTLPAACVNNNICSGSH